MLRDKIVKVIDDYLEYLDAGGEPVALPPKRHKSRKDSVPVSYLGACPRKKALERRNYPMILQHNDWKENPEARRKMEFGNRIEALLQEALIWSGYSDRSTIEVNITLERPRLHGRIDAIVNVDGEDHILECKQRGAFGGKPAEPFIKEVYQLMSYMVATGLPGHIIIVDRGPVQLYTLLPSNGGFRLYRQLPEEERIATNHRMELWNHPQNNEEWLSIEMLEKIGDMHLANIQADSEVLINTVPIEDPLSKESTPLFGDHWQCVKIATKPRYRKTKENFMGEVIPNCPYQCQPALKSGKPVVVDIDSDGIVFLRDGQPPIGNTVPVPMIPSLENIDQEDVEEVGVEYEHVDPRDVF